MDRRQFIALSSVAAAALPIGARGQAPERRLVAALLQSESAGGRASLQAFERRLQALGWSQQDNLELIIRWAGDDIARVDELAAELVEMHPAVVLVQGTSNMLALTKLGSPVPLVFVQVTDPVAAGFVRNLSRPGGQVTGFANFGPQVAGTRLRLLKEVAPKLTRVLIVRHATYPTSSAVIEAAVSAAASLQLQLIGIDGVRDAGELVRALTEFGARPDAGLDVFGEPFTNANSALITRLAAEHNLPAVYASAAPVELGGLVSYGVDVPAVWGNAAAYVDQILRGTNPGDLPVQEPTEPEIVLNVRAARALGLAVPATVLGRAPRRVG